jgi:hypothetical protein
MSLTQEIVEHERRVERACDGLRKAAMDLASLLIRKRLKDEAGDLRQAIAELDAARAAKYEHLQANFDSIAEMRNAFVSGLANRGGAS